MQKDTCRLCGGSGEVQVSEDDFKPCKCLRDDDYSGPEYEADFVTIQQFNQEP